MIVYLTMDGLHSSPFISQVLGYTAPLVDAGEDLRLLVWTRETEDRTALIEERKRLTRNALGDRVRFFKRGRNYGPITRRKLIRDIKEALTQWNISPTAPIIFHARSPWAGLAALQMKKIRRHSKVITDFRGTMTAEARLVLDNMGFLIRMAGSLWIRESSRAERVCAKESDHLLCVSQAFKQLLIGRYGLKGDKISVVPCFVDTQRFVFDPKVRQQARQEFEIDPNAHTLLYCGTLRYYSKNDEIMGIFKKIKATHPKAVLLMVTPDKALAQEAALKNSVPLADIRVVCGGPEKVSKWLQAGDLAFLLRDQDEVNLVACPMKFAEYIRSGVKTMITPGLGDLAEFIQTRDAGWVHSHGEPIPENISAPYGDDERQRISDAAAKAFGREQHLPRVRHLYQALNSNLRGMENNEICAEF